MKNWPEHKVTIWRRVCSVTYAQYENGRVSIGYNIEETGEPMGRLTINLPNETLAEDEFAVKDWSENTFVAEAAFKTGLFEDTGRTIQAGFVEAPVWRFKENAEKKVEEKVLVLESV